MSKEDLTWVEHSCWLLRKVPGTVNDLALVACHVLSLFSSSFVFVSHAPNSQLLLSHLLHGFAVCDVFSARATSGYLYACLHARCQPNHTSATSVGLCAGRWAHHSNGKRYKITPISVPPHSRVFPLRTQTPPRGHAQQTRKHNQVTHENCCL